MVVDIVQVRVVEHNGPHDDGGYSQQLLNRADVTNCEARREIEDRNVPTMNAPVSRCKMRRRPTCVARVKFSISGSER